MLYIAYYCITIVLYILYYFSMLAYCLKLGLKTDSKNPRVVKTQKRNNNGLIKLRSLWY